MDLAFSNMQVSPNRSMYMASFMLRYFTYFVICDLGERVLQGVERMAASEVYRSWRKP